MKRIIDFVRHPRAAVIVHDFCMVLIAWFASVWLIRNTSTNEMSAMSSLFIVLVLQGSVFWATGLYKGLWRFASFQDMWNIVRACTFGAIAIVAALGDNPNERDTTAYASILSGDLGELLRVVPVVMIVTLAVSLVEAFLILPHKEVAEYRRRKTEDYDRWLGGMRKLRRTIGVPSA